MNSIAQRIIQRSTRPFLLAAAIALGSATTAFAACPATPEAPIHQEIDFKASPEQVYEALLDEKQFSAVAGGPVQIQRDVGGAIKLFSGRVTGRNVELVPNRRIVQAWRLERWPPGIYSIVSFQLNAQGSGTHLVLDQVGFPPEEREEISSNWPRKYWDRLRMVVDAES